MSLMTGIPPGGRSGFREQGFRRAAWLRQARSYLRRADLVLARLIDDRPVVRWYEPGEDWYWCYLNRLVFELEGAPSAPSHL